MINSIKQGKFAMLAFAQQKKAINWNQTMFLQPKLDGVRCIFTKQGAYSRSGKKFKNVQHLRREQQLTTTRLTGVIAVYRKLSKLTA